MTAPAEEEAAERARDTEGETSRGGESESESESERGVERSLMSYFSIQYRWRVRGTVGDRGVVR